MIEEDYNIPESLKDFVYEYNGNIYPKQKLPRELEEEYDKFINKVDSLRCPICKEKLMYKISDEYKLYCNKCNKYFNIKK